VMNADRYDLLAALEAKEGATVTTGNGAATAEAAEQLSSTLK